MTVPGDAKRELRGLLLANRAARPAAERREAAGRLRDRVLALPELAVSRVVAAYVSIGTEPPTGPLLDALTDRGIQVLLPVLRPDGDLDWGPYDGPASLSAGLGALSEPRGARLGVDAISSAGAVVLPALAVDRRGNRLGRGGGAYDRALRRATGLTLALLYEGELLPAVPVEAHDVAVGGAATPVETVRFA